MKTLLLILLTANLSFAADLKDKKDDVLQKAGTYKGKDNSGQACKVEYKVKETARLGFDYRNMPDIVEAKVSFKSAWRDFSRLDLKCSRPDFDRNRFHATFYCRGQIGIQGDGQIPVAVTMVLNEGFVACHPQDRSLCITGPYITFFEEQTNREIHCESLK